MKHIGEIMTALNRWMKSFIDNGLKGFVVGVSGGVDSAVVSSICAETGCYVACVTMPIGNPVEHYNRAHLHIQSLQRRQSGENISHIHIDLSDSFRVLADSIPSQFKTDLALANIKSRLRMVTLYSIANSMGYLVAGTGNAIEDMGVGYFTRYGDGGVDISPIGSFTKTEVYQLAEYFGVSKYIINAAPTDGLWEGSPTDEERMGISYPRLEKAMKVCELLHLETLHDFEVVKKIVSGIDVPYEDIEKYLSMHEKNAFKMKMPPIFKPE